MSFRASVLTLYPEMFPGPLGLSLAGRALDAGTWSLEPIQIRDFADDKHRTVDDTPAGGGAGMVMRADILAKAIDHAAPPGDLRPRLLMSPRGRPLTQAKVRELAAGPGVVIVCGRFEGVDQRVIDARALEEVSVGDYILSGGEPAALVLLDAVVRLLPGVMGNELSGDHESFEGGLLEYPHYTRPQEFEGRAIPEVLVSGNHAKVAAWRHEPGGEIDGRTAARPRRIDRSAREEVIGRQEEPDGDDKDADGHLRHAFRRPDAGIAAERRAGHHDDRLQPGNDAARNEHRYGDGRDDDRQHTAPETKPARREGLRRELTSGKALERRAVLP